MQLICRESDEHGHHMGLGWIQAKVRRFDGGARRLRVPHVGWNDVTGREGSTVCPEDGTFYFVHSYHVDGVDRGDVAATCLYGKSSPRPSSAGTSWRRSSIPRRAKTMDSLSFAGSRLGNQPTAWLRPAQDASHTNAPGQELGSRQESSVLVVASYWPSCGGRQGLQRPACRRARRSRHRCTPRGPLAQCPAAARYRRCLLHASYHGRWRALD